MLFGVTETYCIDMQNIKWYSAARKLDLMTSRHRRLH